ncbi:MAG: DNA-directed RNA polymerase subunit N [Aeropyrum sp.]|nr:DNA-directed RNA polymerase subunit N [Aeropyrum sp.]MCE4615535.1 DNA-directed RNA polymerase subunit N [Aeropyrum sp.]
MLPPVRCFTCGRPIGHLWPRFKELVESGKKPGDALDELGVTRYCCRRMLFTAVTYIEATSKYRLGIPVPEDRIKIWG